MKARVYVSFKTTVLDPQGQTIRAALNAHGHPSIHDIRQGKFFEISITDGPDAKAEIEQIAKDVLTNPVIEDYRIDYLD